jgi:hypothetical protein
MWSIGDKMNEKKLHDYYKKYVSNKKFYRVISSEYEKDIRIHGLTSKRNPYKKKYNDIKKFFKIVLWLEEYQDFNHTQDWGLPELITADRIIKTSLRDMRNEYIDFAPHLCEMRYYKKLIDARGSALVSTMRIISDDILSRKPKLPSWTNYTFIKSINKWAKQRGRFSAKVLYVKGSSKALEKATYQIALSQTNKLPSPLGSFAHFKKVVNRYGLKPFKNTLEANPRKRQTRKTHLNLRIKGSIPKEDIEFIK